MGGVIGSRIEDLDTPALLIDGGALRRNIERMADFFRGRPAQLRPHFKNHKCTHIARLQLAAGSLVGITAAKLGEAEVLAVFEKNLLSGLDEQSQERIKMLAAMAIGEVATAETYKYLSPLLQDSSKVVRLSAAKAVLRASAGRLGR